MNVNPHLPFVAGTFAIAGDFIAGQPYGSGHINDTFAVTYSQAGTPVRYLFQRINDHVFREPLKVMDNILRVTSHAAKTLQGGVDASRKALTVIPSRTGLPYVTDPDGKTWRAYLFIEAADTFDRVQSSYQAQEAARAFGAFQSMVATLQGERLHETIPGFHHTRSRFEKLRAAIGTDQAKRADSAADEIAFALSRESIVDTLLDAQTGGELPERVTHNDTKLNNVMFDRQTGEAICVIDLDTVMPGLVLYDFGDMVRTATSPAEEDERDLSKVVMQMPMFEALARGYVAAAKPFLTDAERAYLAFSGKLITFEIGIRFLTDFLEGDVYFKTKRPDHNLDRCRTQFRLVQSIEAQEDSMRRFVDSLD